VFVLVRYSYDLRVPRRFGGFVQVLQTVQVAVQGRIQTHIFVEIIVFTFNKVFEYMEMTFFSCPCGSGLIPRRFDFFVQVFEALEMTVFGSMCTRIIIHRTLVCDAIL